VRLLLHNPNTDAELTDRLAARARGCLGPGDTLASSTASRGSPFIGSAQAIATARRALDSDLGERTHGYDAVLLGCFGDLGVSSLRRQWGRPVVSLSDAVFALAPLLGRRMGLVTTSPFWAARLARDARRRGATSAIAALVAVEETAEKRVEVCRETINAWAREGLCDVAVLGGAALAALTPEVTIGAALPLLDPLAAAIGLCRSASWPGPEPGLR
jgi:allantoin racemase